MTKPASAPPADALLPCPFCGGNAWLEEIAPHQHRWATFIPDHGGSATVECGCGVGMIEDNPDAAAKVTAKWNKRAASAQVREVERRCPYCAGRIYTDAGCQNCKVGTTYPKPAPEPVPVAQASADSYIGIASDYRDGILNDPEMRRAMVAAFADHARIVAGMQQTIDTAIDVLDHSAERIEALEASLAACRAERDALALRCQSLESRAQDNWSPAKANGREGALW